MVTRKRCSVYKMQKRAAAVAGGALMVLCGGALCGGVAHADEYHHPGSEVNEGFALLRTGQIDDPAEDVAEHLALFKDDYTTD